MKIQENNIRLGWNSCTIAFPRHEKGKKKKEEEDYSGLLFRPAWSLCIGTGLCELSTPFCQLK